MKDRYDDQFLAKKNMKIGAKFYSCSYCKCFYCKQRCEYFTLHCYKFKPLFKIKKRILRKWAKQYAKVRKNN